jgi:hydroxymethylglutaryl-CoA synthase
MVGIISYGTYIPKYRIKTVDIANFWNKQSFPSSNDERKNEEEIKKRFGLLEKSVASIDEDATTLAVESALVAIESGKIKLEDIKALSVGSESHPYAVKPTSTIVGEILGIPHNYLAIDTQFACKAATAAMRLISMMDELKEHKVGLVIGSDVAQAKPGDALEYTAASAAAAFVMGGGPVIADILSSTSYSSDTPDFWRRDGQKFPSHAGRFTGEAAYFSHIINASSHLLEKTETKPSDYDHVIFHMPNCKFPKEVAKKLGFSPKQLATGFKVEQIGNPYSASSLLGLAAVLDVAKPNQKIFLCSYGSGAGSDAFIIHTTSRIVSYQINKKTKVSKQIENKEYIEYSDLIKILMSKGYV